MTTSPQNALVVGAGLAGTTAAISLARAGLSVDVVDLKDQPAGAAITLLNRAIDGLDEIGVLDRLVEQGVPVEPADLFRYYNAAGEQLPVPLPPRRTDAHLPHGLIIYRPDLAATLIDATRQAGADVGIGVALSGLTQVGDEVEAELSDGTTRRYDLVVGADGVFSTTRQLLLGDAVTPTYSGETMFRWVVDGVPDVGPVGFYQSPTALIVTLRLRDGRIYIAAGRSFDERPGLTQEQARDIVRENLATFTAPLQQAILERLTDDATLIINDYNWLMTPSPWHRGSTILIGDAAHATTAHLASGGGMAIEDGVVLGQEVARGGTLPEIFDRVMERRFDRTRLVVETSVEINDLQHQGASVEQQNALRGKAMAALAAPY